MSSGSSSTLLLEGVYVKGSNVCVRTIRGPRIMSNVPSPDTSAVSTRVRGVSGFLRTKEQTETLLADLLVGALAAVLMLQAREGVNDGVVHGDDSVLKIPSLNLSDSSSCHCRTASVGDSSSTCEHSVVFKIHSLAFSSSDRAQRSNHSHFSNHHSGCALHLKSGVSMFRGSFVHQKNPHPKGVLDPELRKNRPSRSAVPTSLRFFVQAHKA